MKKISPLARLIGANIRRERMRRDFTREYVAVKAEITAQYLSLAENGHRFFSMNTYIRIAAVLHIEPEVLFVSENSSSASDTDSYMTPHELISEFTTSTASERRAIAIILSAIKRAHISMKR